MSNNTKHIGLVCRTPPYGNSKARELIDIALAAGVFDQKVCLIFLGDGVFQLQAGQSPTSIEQKNHGKLIDMLEIYGIDNIVAQESAMLSRDLKRGEINKDFQILDDASINTLISEQHVMMSL